MSLTTRQQPGRDTTNTVVSRPPRPRTRRWWRADNTSPWVWFAATLFLVVLPVWGLLWKSLELPEGGIGLGNYAAALSRADILEAIGNSFVIAILTTLGALVVAVPFAMAVSLTDMPGRRFFRSVAVLTFAAPGFIAAMGWILLLGPRAGLLNEFVITPLGLPPFDIFSVNGVVFALVFFLYPLIFLPATDALDNMDRRLEEAAESLGSSRFQTFRRVTLPLILPGVFSGSLLVFISAFVIFGPVALLGGPVGFKTIPTAMYDLMMTFPPRIEYAAVLGLPVLVALAGLLLLQRQLFGRRRFTTVGGKPGMRHVHRLGPWKIPVLLGGIAVMVISIVLPFGVLLLTSFRKAIGLPLALENMVLGDNYAALLERPEILTSFWNSIWTALVASLGAIAIALLAGWLLERGRTFMKPMIQTSMLAPLAFPGAILGIAAVIAYGGGPLWLGGTLAIMAIAYAIRVIPQSFQYIHAGFKQVSGETEEASRSLGASWSETMRRVTVPLLRGPILSVGILNFVILFRELDTSIFLYSGANPVAPVVLYNFATRSQFQLMGALAVVMLILNLGIVLIARKTLSLKV